MRLFKERYKNNKEDFKREQRRIWEKNKVSMRNLNSKESRNSGGEKKNLKRRDKRLKKWEERGKEKKK